MNQTYYIKAITFVLFWVIYSNANPINLLASDNTPDEDKPEVIYSNNQFTGMSKPVIFNNEITFLIESDPKGNFPGYPDPNGKFSKLSICSESGVLFVVEEDSTAPVHGSDIAIINEKNLALIYSKPTGVQYGFNGHYKVFDGSNIISENEFFSNANWGGHMRLNVSKDNIPHIIAFSSSMYYVNYFIKTDKWYQTTITPTNFSFNNYYTCLDNETLHFIGRTNNEPFKIIHYQSTNDWKSWENESAIDNITGSPCDFVMSKYGVFHILYTNNGKLMLAKKNKQWNFENIVDNIDVLTEASMIFTPNNKPIVAYQSNDKLVVMMENENSWQVLYIHENLSTERISGYSYNAPFLIYKDKSLYVLYDDGTNIYKKNIKTENCDLVPDNIYISDQVSDENKSITIQVKDYFSLTEGTTINAKSDNENISVITINHSELKITSMQNWVGNGNITVFVSSGCLIGQGTFNVIFRNVFETATAITNEPLVIYHDPTLTGISDAVIFKDDITFIASSDPITGNFPPPINNYQHFKLNLCSEKGVLLNLESESKGNSTIETSIAVSHDNKIIAFFHATPTGVQYGHKGYYKEFDGKNIVFNGILFQNANWTGWPTLVFDHKNDPHITTFSASNYYPKYFFRNSESWYSGYVSEQSYNYFYIFMHSIFDNEIFHLIGRYRNGPENILVHHWYTLGKWSNETIVDTNITAPCDIQILNDGTVQFLYNQDDTLKLAQKKNYDISYEDIALWDVINQDHAKMIYTPDGRTVVAFEAPNEIVVLIREKDQNNWKKLYQHDFNDSSINYYSRGPSLLFKGNILYVIYNNEDKVYAKQLITSYNDQYSLSFNGLNQYINCDSFQNVNFDNNLTIEAVIKIDKSNSLINKQHIVNIYNNSTKNTAIAFGIDHQHLLFVYNDQEYIADKTIIKPDTLYNVAAAVDMDGQISFYVNGIKIQSMNFTSNIIDSYDFSDILFGCKFDGEDKQPAELYNGEIGEVRIWNRVLSDEELFTNPSKKMFTGVEKGLVGYWPFDEGFNDTVHDVSLNNNNCKLINMQNNWLITSPISEYKQYTAIISALAPPYKFDNTDISISINSNENDVYTLGVMKIFSIPENIPASAEKVLTNHYWIVKPFDKSPSKINLYLSDHSLINNNINPENIIIFCRETPYDSWKYLKSGKLFDSDQILFENLTFFGEYILGLSDFSNPTLTITSPADNDMLTSINNIQGIASDSSYMGLSCVYLQIKTGDIYLNTDGLFSNKETWIKAEINNENDTWKYNLNNVELMKNKIYTITAKTIDNSENISKKTINIYYSIKKSTNIICTISKNIINIGESFEITGQVQELQSGDPVFITITSDNTEPIRKTVNTLNDGTFKVRISCDEISQSGLWIIKAGWNGNNEFASSVSQQYSILVKKVKPELTLDQTFKKIKIKCGDDNCSVDFGGKFSIDNSCTFQNLLGIDLKLIFSYENDTYTEVNIQTYNDEGNYKLLSYKGFDQIGMWQLQTVFEGNESYSPCESNLINLEVIRSAGYAIIIQGKIETSEGLKSHFKTLQFVYNTFKDQGLFEEDIKFFHYYNDEIPYDNKNIFKPDKSRIEYAISNWAITKVNENPSNLYIVMVDHGKNGTFYLDQETITSKELKGYIEKFENGLNENAKNIKIVTILGFCFSGSFIEDLSGQNRVIITSAAKDEYSFKGPIIESNIRDGEYFVTQFFKGVLKNYSIKQAFEKAVNLTEKYLSPSEITYENNSPYYDQSMQHPLIDDNGDELGSNDLAFINQDGDLSNTIYIGTSVIMINSNIEIIEVADTIFLSENEISTEGQLWAKLNNNNVSSVVMELKPPDYEIKIRTNEQAELILDRKMGVLKNDYMWFIDKTNEFKITEPGMYRVYYFIKDNESDDWNTSVDKETIIYKNKQGNKPPNEFSLIYPIDSQVVYPIYIKDKDKYFVLLRWNEAMDPDKDPITYTIYLSKSNSFPQTDTYKQPLVDSNTYLFELPDLWDNETKIYWKVRAIDKYGLYSDTTYGEFKTWNSSGSDHLAALIIINSINKDFVKGAIVKGKPEVPTSDKTGKLFLFKKADSEFENTCIIEREGYYSSQHNIQFSRGETKYQTIPLEPILGDVNGDKEVNLKDAILLIKLSTGIYINQYDDKINDRMLISDINNDDKITFKEILYILQKISRM